jgi:hypothetical protein
MERRVRQDLPGGCLNGLGTAPTAASPEAGASSQSQAAGLAALLKMRAEAQGAGCADLERQLREQIRGALPICRIDADDGVPVLEARQDEPRTDAAAPHQAPANDSPPEEAAQDNAPANDSPPEEAAPDNAPTDNAPTDDSPPEESSADEEFLVALRGPPGQPVRTKMAQLATLPALEGRRSERRVLNLAADLRENGGSVAEVEVANISQDGFLIQSHGGLTLEIGSFAWLKLPGFEPLKSQVVRVAEDKLGGRFLTPLYPAVLELMLKEEPRARVRRLFHPPRPSAAA